MQDEKKKKVYRMNKNGDFLEKTFRYSNEQDIIKEGAKPRKDILKENAVLVSPIRTIRPVGDVGSQIKMSDLVKEEEQNEERQIDTNAFLGMVNRFGRIGEDIKVNDLRGIQMY